MCVGLRCVDVCVSWYNRHTVVHFTNTTFKVIDNTLFVDDLRFWLGSIFFCSWKQVVSKHQFCCWDFVAVSSNLVPREERPWGQGCCILMLSAAIFNAVIVTKFGLAQVPAFSDNLQLCGFCRLTAVCSQFFLIFDLRIVRRCVGFLYRVLNSVGSGSLPSLNWQI